MQFWLQPILKRRFTSYGMWLESHILDYLGEKYYKGDRVVWEEHRRAAWKMWKRGCTANEMASRHKIPVYIVTWWIEIWEMYDNAWGWIE